jgi:transposase
MQVYIGIDWSSEKHDIAFLNSTGELLGQLVIGNTPEGFARFDDFRTKLGVAAGDCLVGIETSHLLLVDYLSTHQYSQLYILPPSQVYAARGRKRASRASSDPQDAQLIADLLRTDRARWPVWQPDSLLTQQIAALVSLERFLTRDIIRLTNRLRQTLWRYYPAGAQVFSRLDSLIALQFLLNYPTPQAAEQLSWAEFQQFARTQHYPNPKKLPARFARLQRPQPAATLAAVQAYTPNTQQLAHLTKELVVQRSATEKRILRLFAQHPDGPIFASLPGVGDKLAPALLAKFGDDRTRFPTPASLQAVAGTCPVTKRSGKRWVVYFRQACDHEFRTIVQLWAKASLEQSVWANTYFQQNLPHSHSTSHAYRRLANRWLAIAWRMWQDRVEYNEAYHMERHTARIKPKAD